MTNLLSTNHVDDLHNQIEGIVVTKRNKVVYQINNAMLETYFLIGKLIVENEQNGNIHAEYGKQILNELSKRLTKRFGSGFSKTNLQHMRLFYIRYQKNQPLANFLEKQDDIDQKSQTVSGQLEGGQKSQPAGQLSWSHYCYLIYIENDDERSFYEKECINCNWSKRELKRQIDSCLFERLLLSNGKKIKKKFMNYQK